MKPSVGERIAEDWACARLIGTLAEAIDAACAKAKAFAAPAWQPIETAPKDGSLLLFFVNGEPQLISWNQKIGNWQEQMTGSFLSEVTDEATHWMPVHAPPASAGEGAA